MGSPIPAVTPPAANMAVPAASVRSPSAAHASSDDSKHEVSDAAQLQQAVDALNRHFSSTRTDLRFSVEKDLNRIVVAVVDAQDGSVLRQIPSEDALRIARMLQSGLPGDTHLVEAQA